MLEAAVVPLSSFLLAKSSSSSELLFWTILPWTLTRGWIGSEHQQLGSSSSWGHASAERRKISNTCHTDKILLIHLMAMDTSVETVYCYSPCFILWCTRCSLHPDRSLATLVLTLLWLLHIWGDNCHYPCINSFHSIYLHLLFFVVVVLNIYSICQKYSEFKTYFSVHQVTLSRLGSSKKSINTSSMPLFIAIMKILVKDRSQITMKPWLNELKCINLQLI